MGRRLLGVLSGRSLGIGQLHHLQGECCARTAVAGSVNSHFSTMSPDPFRQHDSASTDDQKRVRAINIRS